MQISRINFRSKHLDVGAGVSSDKVIGKDCQRRLSSSRW